VSTKPAALKAAFTTLQGKLSEEEVPVWASPFLILTNRRLFSMTGFTGNKLDWVTSLEDISSVNLSVKKGVNFLEINFSDGTSKTSVAKNKSEFDEFNAVFDQLRNQGTGEIVQAAESLISSHKADKFGAPTNWKKDLPGWLSRTIQQNRIDDEKIEAIIVGDVAFDGALVGFSDRCMILKGGAIGSFMSDSLGGGRATTFYYKQITGIEFNGGMINGVLEVLTPSYQGTANKDYWKGLDIGYKANRDGNNPYTLSNTLPMTKINYQDAKPLIDIIRKKIADAHSPTIVVNQQQPSDLAGQIKNLADLHSQGILSDEEFQKAKGKLLGQ
jgi:hypothetical protein